MMYISVTPFYEGTVMQKVFSDPKNSLILSQDKQNLLLLTSQFEQDSCADDIINLIKNSDYANFKLNIDGVNHAVRYLSGQSNQTTAFSHLEPIVVAESCDAELEILFDPLKVAAKAVVISACGGKAITEEYLRASMENLNITVGIIDSAVDLLLNKSAQSPGGTRCKIMIAEGLQPKDGSNAFFETLVEASKTKLIDRIDLYGSVDLSNLRNIISVQPGTPLIRKFPHIAGQDGLTVTGEVIPSREGKDLSLSIGENTKICESDPNLLVASVIGNPIDIDNGMEIEPILVLDKIEQSSETFYHNGSLVIKGDLASGTKIVTTGDLTIFGFIESSYVKCGGDIFVAKGILGEQINKSNSQITCTVKCAGSLYTNFIQYSNINVAKNLNVKCQLLHSNVSCMGHVNIQDKTGKRGTIFGGVLSAQKSIRTVTIGAVSGVQTVVNLTAGYSLLLDDKKRLHLSLEQTKGDLQQALTAKSKLEDLDFLKDVNKVEEIKNLDNRLALTIKDYKKHNVETINNIQYNQQQIQEYLMNTKLHASKSIFNNVSVLIGEDVFFSSNRRYGATTVCIKNDQIIAGTYEYEY
jgi:uncharacterized protein (DUF342 family)